MGTAMVSPSAVIVNTLTMFTRGVLVLIISNVPHDWNTTIINKIIFFIIYDCYLINIPKRHVNMIINKTYGITLINMTSIYEKRIW